MRFALPRTRRADAGQRAAALRAEIAAHGADAERAHALGDALEAAGRRLEAIDALTAANRLRPEAALERRLVRLRRKAFSELALAPSSDGPAPASADAAREIAPDALTADALRAGILGHGCLLVRGLVPRARVERLRAAIDRAFVACEATLAGRAMPERRAWYDPVERVPKDASRTWVRAGQGVLAADSPRAFFEFMETVYALRLDALATAYLGERPALSVEKCVLRRADASLHQSTWHQDGAFLGDGIRTLDVWLALSRCGRDAPGLELIPLRLARVLPTGEPGTYFEWTASPETIERELPGAPRWRPAFEEGDVLFFDHLLLHRTAAEPAMPGVRYAIESWWFAASVYPRTSTPLVV